MNATEIRERIEKILAKEDYSVDEHGKIIFEYNEFFNFHDFLDQLSIIVAIEIEFCLDIDNIILEEVITKNKSDIENLISLVKMAINKKTPIEEPLLTSE
ncbi:MAG: hypothetical protein WC415_06385 [Patescibacteria group bacterium]|jgi:hypothetical protein